MKLKANLHFHTQDDPQDVVDYSFQEGMDAASRLGFEVLALTCHHKFIDSPTYSAYAAERNVLLIPGVERDIEHRHVVILNADEEIEKVETFAELAAYKKNHPAAFVLAPHPYFGTPYCLGRKLEEHIGIFDAIEYSWFYSKGINRNLKAEALAKKQNLPYLAASDTHELRTLDKSYALIETGEKTAAAVLTAIKNKNFENFSAPSKFWSEMIVPKILSDLKKYWRKIYRKITITERIFNY